MKRRSKKSNESFSFPDDILFQILLLLPFKSLKTCQLVSKQWNDLIKDPNFATRYRHNGSLIILLDESELYGGLITHNKKMIHSPSCTLHRIPTGFKSLVLSDTSRHELLSGWSNGNMVCVKTSKGIFRLYNLFTRDTQVVKTTRWQLNPASWVYYGFGYDRYDDDYKIVLVCKHNPQYSSKSTTELWVYSHKNRCWNVFDGFPYDDYSWPCLAEGLCYSFNGVLHSIVVVNDESLKKAIVTYDIHTRRFGEMSMPDDGMSCDMAKVTEFDGRLCYTYWLADKWVMEVYDVEGCWTKVLRIDSLVTTNHLNTFYGLEYAALYERRNGRKMVLLASHGTLIWYDCSTEKIKSVDAYKAWRNRRRLIRLTNKST